MSPYHHSSQSASRTKRTSEGAFVLTSSLYLILAKKQRKERQKKVKRRKLSLEEPQQRVHVKRSKAACKPTKERCGPQDDFKRANEPRPSSQKLNEDDADPRCLFCSELLSNSREHEPWIKYTVCHNWAQCE